MPAVRATCEPCRLRRVKCDLRDGRTECTNCVKRRYKCPGPGVVATRRPRRGAVVDKVEVEYGSSVPTTPAAISTPSAPSLSEVTDVVLANESSSSIVSLASEQALVRLEMRSELALSMLSSFHMSHGWAEQLVVEYVRRSSYRAIFKTVWPGELPDQLLAVRGRFDDLRPTEEIMVRFMLAMGARTTMHPVILQGADLTFPHTLGIVREGPCRTLIGLALSRYESLGIWRECSLQAIQMSVMIFLLSRTINSIAYARPILNTAVGLFRQYLSLHPPETHEDNTDLFNTGQFVLWADARGAAESGDRPLFTEEDLDEYPALRTWLNQPLAPARERQAGKSTVGFGPDARINANLIRVLRAFASDIHRPLRRNSTAALERIPQFLEDLDALSLLTSTELGRVTEEIQERPRANDGQYVADPNSSAEFPQLLMVNTSCTVVTLSLYSLLKDALARTSNVEYVSPFLDIVARAPMQLKRVAEHVRMVQRLGTGPAIWISMTRLFHELETMPFWTEIMRMDGTNTESPLSDDDREVLAEGVRIAGFGAGFAPLRWLDAMRARGIDLIL